MQKKESLLQKAKKIPMQKSRINHLPQDFEEVALAWCRDEISLTQICKAMGLDNTGYRVYAKLALTLKQYFNKNYRK